MLKTKKGSVKADLDPQMKKQKIPNIWKVDKMSLHVLEIAQKLFWISMVPIFILYI